MKNSLQEWWKAGTTKARLLSSGANLKQGFLNPTNHFKRLHRLSYDDDKMIQECGNRLATLVKRQIEETCPGDGLRYQHLDTLLNTVHHNPTLARAQTG
eukprot:2082949-Prorocentrum_lima.AAC.1